MRRFKHLSFTDRIRIEDMLKERYTPKQIADVLRVHISTIYREVKRGVFERLNSDYTTEMRYSPDIAEQRYRENLKAKGKDLKIGNDHAFAQYIEERIINDNYSPAAVLGEIKRKALPFATIVCKTTLYSYIDKGVFLRLTNKSLIIKGKRKHRYRHVKPKRPPRGESIEKRPEHIEDRKEFGHWEMDCIEGRKGTKKTLLMLTERKTREEIMFRMKDQTAKSVNKCLDKLEKKYGNRFSQIFKTITVDNGSEFADCAGMERSCISGGKRTKIYYCHPYSSWERGSNENQNRMARRVFPKGTDFRRVTEAMIQHTEEWINNYPRKIFDFATSSELFAACVADIP